MLAVVIAICILLIASSSLVGAIPALLTDMGGVDVDLLTAEWSKSIASSTCVGNGITLLPDPGPHGPQL